MRLEYLDTPGAREPRVVLLYDLTGSSVEALRAAVAALADGAGSSFRVDELPGIEAVGRCRLEAAVGAEDVGVEQLGERAFRCALTAAGWRRVHALLEPFTEHQPGTFQYLTDRGDVEWIVSTSRGW